MKLAFRRRKPGRVQWISILFLTLCPIIGIAALVYFLRTDTLVFSTVLLTAAFTLVAGMGTTTGYHRLFSHRSYEATQPVRIWLLFTGILGLQGSALEWSLDHRAHHRFVDRDKDPYSIKKGFWFAHILWIFKTRARDMRPSHNSDLWRDKFVFLQHRYFMPLAITVNFGLPALIAGIFWNDILGGFLIAGFLRLVFTHHTTFMINSVCHYFGTRPYSDKHTARDNAITALFTWGEGYHNFHHEFSNDYRNGVRWFQFDPGKWAIGVMAFLGLARGLKRVPNATIKQRRMQIQKKEMLSKLEKWGWTEERKAAFHAQLEHTLELFKRRATLMNQARNSMIESATQMTEERLNLMQMRYEKLKNAVEQTAIEFKVLRRTARA